MDIIASEVSDVGVKMTPPIRDTRQLMKEELEKNKVEVAKGKFKEWGGLQALGCFERYPRSKSRKRVDTRWVVTWRFIGGVMCIKCRITMRGFRDRCDTLET